MKVLGLRCSKTEIRYAIIESQNGGLVFENKDGETKLKFPTSITVIEDKLVWFESEIERILRQNADISVMAVKVNEFAGTETWAKREGAYLDATAILSGKKNNINVYKKIYSQMKVKSSNVQNKAEKMVGRTNKYWDKKIADAICCAISVAGDCQ